MKAILEWKSKELPIDLNYVREHFALSDNDACIEKILSNAIEHIELENGISLQKKIWKIVHDNNFVVLNFAPIVKLISTTDGNNNPIEPIFVKRANDSVSLQFNALAKVVKVTYEAGYDASSLPECLKLSILEKFWDLYSENIAPNMNYHFANKLKEGSHDRYHFKS